MSSRRLLSGANRAQGRSNATATSSSRPSNHNTTSNSPVELPEYEPPSCPLDPTARRALAELANNTDTRKYAEQLSQSLDLLGKSVASLNDRLLERSSQLETMQERRKVRAGDVEKEKGEFEVGMEKAVARLRGSVPGVTERSEAAVREVIDWKVELQDGKAALEEAKRMVEEEEGQMVASMAQRRVLRRQRRDQDGEDEDGAGEEDEQMDEDDEEPISITGPLNFHDQARQKLVADYEAKSLYQRYGLSNDYIQFKKLWHDATHGADRKPLPNARQWFDEDGQVRGEDSDEDIIVAEEVIDLKCPLSLVMMREPYTSKKCKHTFEKAAIFEFLHGRSQMCPQTGCNQEITVKDLYLDEVMLRRIKRALAHEDRNDAGDDDEDDDAEPDADGDVSMRVTSHRNIKTENRRRGRRRQVDEIEDDEEIEKEEAEEEDGEDEDE